MSIFHSIVGIILLALICAQTLGGVINFQFIYEKPVHSNRIHYFKQGHKLNGILLTFIIYINLISGFALKWNDKMYLKYFKLFSAAPAALCGFFLTLIIILEIIFFTHNKNKVSLIGKVQPSSSIRKVHTNELEDEKRSMKYVLFYNYLCDVGPFIKFHPGGSNLIQDNLYSDVTRYITGNQAYSKNFHNHSHNYATQKHLIQKMAYAELIEESGIIIGNKQLNRATCNLISKRVVAENTVEFSFQPVSDSCKFSKFLPGVHYIGKHFLIDDPELNRSRFYSFCFALDETVKEKHLNLLKNIERLEKGESGNLENCSIVELANENTEYSNKGSSYLKLYIKRYNFADALSNKLHSIEKNHESKIQISGPIGVGLGLANNKLKGVHIVLCAGTGIFPFLDLVNYTLRYITSKVSQNNFNNKSNSIFPEESFDEVNSDFQLVFMTTFSNEQSSIYFDVMQKLEALDTKYNLNIFKFIQRVASNNKKRWDMSFIKENLTKYQCNLSKVYLAGPIVFMDEMKESLLKAEIAKPDQLCFV
jgi:ferredoxin-NADP reductase